MSPESIATIVAAGLACVSAIVVAIIQYKQTQTAKRDKELEEANRRAEEAERKLEKERREKEQEELREQLRELNESVGKISESVQKEIQYLGARFDKLKLQTESRLEQHDDSIRKIVDVLSRDARMYSNMMRLHAQTETRLQSIMDMQTYNMKFANETATTLRIIGELVNHAIVNSPEESQKLQAALTDNKNAHSAFVNNLVTAQQDFFKQSMPKSDAIDDDEIQGDRIHELIPLPKKKSQTDSEDR